MIPHEKKYIKYYANRFVRVTYFGKKMCSIRAVPRLPVQHSGLLVAQKRKTSTSNKFFSVAVVLAQEWYLCGKSFLFGL